MGTLFSLQRFDRPWCLWMILAIFLFVWMARRSLAGLGPMRRWLALGARGLVLILLVLALAGTNRILKNNDLTVLFLLDQSRSIPNHLRNDATEFIKHVSNDLNDRDRVAVLTFDGQTLIEQLPNKRDVDKGLHVTAPFPEGGRPDRTNLAQALRMAAACALDSTANRVVLFSDGNQNVGDALEEAHAARANRMVVDVVPLRPQVGSDVVFEKLRVPAYAHLHEQVPLRLILRSDQRTSGTINVYQRVGQEEEAVDLDPNREGLNGQHVTLEPGRNAFSIKLPIRTERSHQFRAQFVPDEGSADVNTENDIAQAFTNVEGPAKVLYVGIERDREDDQHLLEALQKENIHVDYETDESVTLDPATLQDYAAVILSNAPADSFSGAQQTALASYVRDLGGGLIMIGGDESFGAGGWQGSIVEDIMPVRFDVDAVRQIPRGALAIVMHSCEMPDGNKWGIETAVAALKTISSLDYFGVVGWGTAGFAWEVPMGVASNKEAIVNQIRRMQNSDMFDFDTPMGMAVQALLNCRDASTRHMIIISDGDPTPPSSGLINRMVGNKITCSAVMVFPHGGQEIATMKRIANQTGGTYYMLNKPGDAQMLPRIFTKEAKIVRRPLIRDEEFKPRDQRGLSELMLGVDTAIPKLRGYVVTSPRKNVDVDMPLRTNKGDPLLADWQCGFGRTVAFTSGRWNHWGADWTDWPSFSKLWAQAVRWCMQQGSAADFDVHTTIEGDVGRVVIESVSEQDGFANFRRFDGRVVQPDGQSATLPIVQTGPGRYEATFDVKDRGTYLVNIQSPGVGKERPANIRTGVTMAYSPEYKELSTNDGLLRDIASETGGRMLSLDATASEDIFARMPEVVSRQPIWETLLKLAIILFLMDVAVRRVAVDPMKAVVYVRRYVANLAGRFGGGQRAEAVLTDLKDVRARVRSEKTREGDATNLGRETGRAPLTRPAGPAIDAGAKFDTGGKKPTGEFVDALGGASAQEPSADADKPSGKKDELPQESTTARLLKARKKGQGGSPEKKDEK